MSFTNRMKSLERAELNFATCFAQGGNWCKQFLLLCSILPRSPELDFIYATNNFWQPDLELFEWTEDA